MGKRPDLRWLGTESLRYSSPDGGVFSITAEGWIASAGTTPESASVWRAALDGFVHHLKGHLVLHGCAWRVEDQAVAALGPSGAGKSSLLATAIRRRRQGLCDDVLVIPDAKDPQALPSGGSRKLWKDVADFLGEPVEEEQRIQDGFDKFRLALTTGDPAPFAAIFIIDATAGCLEAKRMTPLEASLAFVQNTFTQKALIGQDRTWHMDACATLAERVPVWRLGLPRGLEHLESAVDLMEGAVMESPP